jgi:magnesium transporter
MIVSTGGNSGSQAATLITRAMALGQVTLTDWLRVLRHELTMGLVLGLTLGAIGFVRGAFTPEDVRGNMEKRQEEFKIKVPIGQDNKVDVKESLEDETIWHVYRTGNKFVRLEFPSGCLDVKTQEDTMQVLLPTGEKYTVEDEVVAGKDKKEAAGKQGEAPKRYKVYTLPEKSHVRSKAVSRWDLALVISQAVAMICIWGTLVGSMLPLIFRRVGVDPGIASSPFVATFVDVTGIVIYFSIANIYLL